MKNNSFLKICSQKDSKTIKIRKNQKCSVYLEILIFIKYKENRCLKSLAKVVDWFKNRLLE